MTEIRFVAKEIAASRQRGIPTDEGKLWETLRLDAERAAAGEEMLRGFLDLVVLRHEVSPRGSVSVSAQARRVFDAGRTVRNRAQRWPRIEGFVTAAIADLGGHSEAPRRTWSRKLFKAVFVL